MTCECGNQLKSKGNRPGSDGKYRCVECAKGRQRTAKRVYEKTEKGKAAAQRYQQGDAFKATQKRYLQSEKGKAKQLRYARTEGGKVKLAAKNHKRYWNDPKYYREKALKRIHGVEEYRLADKCAWCDATENLSLDHGHPKARAARAQITIYKPSASRVMVTRKIASLQRATTQEY